MKNNKKLPHGKTAGLDCDVLASQATFGERKLLKVVCGVGLAVLMGAMAFLGAACTPNSAATSGPQGAQGAAGTADGGSNTSLSNPFNFSPTDPTVFTTSNGIEIKLNLVNLEATGTYTTGALAGYCYFTMGSYEGSSVEWIIIGRHSSTTFIPDSIREYIFSNWLESESRLSEEGTSFMSEFVENQYENVSPAGAAIDAVNERKLLIDESVLDSATNNAKIDSELNEGEVLCIAARNLFNISFSPVSSTGNQYATYSNSYLETAVNDLYNNNILGLAASEKTLIQQKSLKTFYYDSYQGKNMLYTSNAFMFPMATYSSEQNFLVATYFPNYNALSSFGNFWSRTPSTFAERAYLISSNSSYLEHQYVNTSWPVRPAMVLKLM